MSQHLFEQALEDEVKDREALTGCGPWELASS